MEPWRGVVGRGNSGPRPALQQILDEASHVEREIELLTYYQESLVPTARELRQLVDNVYPQGVAQRVLQLQEKKRGLVEMCRTFNIPVTRLPVELLSNVFLFATWETVDPASELEGHLPLESMKMTHVCSQWRNVSLECVQLWSVLDFKYPRICEAVLDRGKHASFTVIYKAFSDDLNYKAKADAVVLKVLSENLHRVQHFIVKGAVPRTSGTCSALALKVLDIHTSFGSEHLSTLLQRGFPSIQRLTLDPYLLSWSQLPLSSTLTHIELCGAEDSAEYDSPVPPDGSGVNVPPPAAFLDSLKDLRNLQNLRLCCILPDLPILARPSDAQAFTLPALRNVDLIDKADRIAGLFNFVRVSDSAHLAAFCYDGDGVGANERKASFARLVNNIHASVGMEYGEQRCVQSLRLTFTTGLELHCKATSATSSRTAKLAIDDCWSPLKLAELLDILSNHFTFSMLTSLVVDDIQGLDDHDVWERLGLAPSLRIVTLHHSSPVDLVDTLDRHPDPPFPDPSCPYFPALSTIEIVGLEEEAEEYEFDVEEFTRRLIRMCKRRIKFGYPLIRLRIEESDCFKVEHVARIRQQLPSLKVVWDEFFHKLDLVKYDDSDESSDYTESEEASDYEESEEVG
ncbi:hypothetical protein NMY22_g2695 [Coprinellus aureogranulatus]|nr:hypothetical protein NMY22_g2695 [Coprinellus aureogranulatus]